MIDDLNQLIEAYDAGVYVREDLLNRILSLSISHPVDDIIAALPESWRVEFLSWAREMFDNEIPLRDFVVITQGTPGDDDLEPIARIREWFRTHDQPPLTRSS
jgi:hypothetical protein